VTDFTEMLKARCSDARKRIAEARQAVITAEADLKKWEAALEVELRTKEAGRARGSASEQLNVLTLSDARRKADVFKHALRAAARPLKRAEIVKLAEPALSRAYVYLLAKKMKESGEITIDEEGKISLRREEG
jgi:hypothetical protein